ncbi:MAG: hypothetical protein ACR2QK_10835 [Acidimicrobiales bacterium]
MLLADTSRAAFNDVTSSTGNSFAVDVLTPPTGLTADGGGAATIDWTATSDIYASGHRVFRGSSPGGPYSQIAEVTPRAAVSYVDTPAEGTYYYVSRAFAGNWESVDSSEVSATVYEAQLTGSWQTDLTHTAATGNDRLLLFVASNEESAVSSPTLSSVTYGGQALTKVTDGQVTPFSITASLEIWILGEAGIAAAADTTFVPTWTATPQAPLYVHAVIDDTNQATPTGSVVTGFGPGDTPNPVPMAPVSPAPGDIVIAAATAGEFGAYTPQNGFSLGVNHDDGVHTSTLGTAQIEADGSAVTASMLFTGVNPPLVRRQVVTALVVKVKD